MAQSTKTILNNLTDNHLSQLKIVFTDPKNGKQLRIFANNVISMTHSISRFMNSESCELEFFCQNLQYSDKNP